MDSIPLARARYAQNFVTAFHKKGVSVDDDLINARLPIDLLSDGNNVITVNSLLTFVDQATLRTGMLDMGFWAGSTALENHGLVGYKISRAPDLYSAIQTYISEARAEFAYSDVYLAHKGSSAWLCRAPIIGTLNQQKQIEQYSISAMMQTIRLALGPNWRPERIRLHNTKKQDIDANAYLKQLNIEFDMPVASIEIPTTALATRLRPAKENPDILTQPYELLSSEPLAALRQLLTSYLPYVKFPGINYFADIVGVSARNIQHDLQHRGVTFSQLVDEARSKRAITLLEQPDTITQIAYELGFSDPAHFSRAFKRVVGTSPKVYRRNR